MRIASFNVENLFNRPKAMRPDWDEGRQILGWHAEVNGLLGKSSYTKSDKADILDLLTLLGLRSNDEAEYVILRQNRGHLLSRRLDGSVDIIANGRDDWIGWVELITEPVDQLATRHTARVIKDVRADVQAVIEADNRVALRDFSAIMLHQVDAQPFDHVMLIDGNDQRGIDVGILTRSGYDIVGIRSHVDDTDATGGIFSRDCPEYTIRTPLGNELIVLVNHFKSKGFGSQASSNAKRRRQATRVAQIYRDLTSGGQGNVVVLGDLNDFPDTGTLDSLLKKTDLRDISCHPKFKPDGRPGTYGNGTWSQKLDYLLLSPGLFDKVSRGGVERRGVWGGVHGTLFPHYPTMTAQVHQASDHAAIWADVNV
jgi:endonuclease/exonuclease/phosphatase family metal-dependent hydrolase